jgi:2'-5' RNA ligase
MPSWFVALPIETEGWLDRLPDPPPGTRRVAAGDLHLTVAFLGNVGPERASEAFAAVDAASIPPLRVRLGRVVPMGPARRPSALSVRVEDAADAPASLAERLAPVRDAVLRAVGLPPEERAMRPHVTLARPARRARAAERRRALAWAEDCGDLGVRVGIERVALYVSAGGSGALAYEIVESRPLGPASGA